jgi:acetyl esterase/lipase
MKRVLMIYFFQNYLGSVQAGDNRLISLVDANLTGLPSTTIIGAEIDPLRTEGQVLRDRLQAAGVPVRYQLYTGVTHEFFGAGVVIGKAKNAVQFAAEGLRASLATP